MKTALRSVLVWCGFLVLAFVNGAFRELFMIKFLGIAPHPANQISCLTGITLWTLLFMFTWRKLEAKKTNQVVLIAMGWIAATVMFETFILNRKLTWSQILQTYNVSAGEYWGLVVLWLGLLPIVAYSVDLVRHSIRNRT